MIKDKKVWKETFIDAWKDFRSFKGRNVLALLGIVIGTAAVIAMLHVGHNAREEAINEFSKLGTNIIGISLLSSGEVSFAKDDIFAYPSINSAVKKIAAVTNTSGTIRVGRDELPVQVLAVSQNYYSIASAQLASGRYTYDVDKFMPYAVIGSTIADQLQALSGHSAVVGQLITLQNQTFTIIGILKPTSSNNILMSNLNDTVLIPLQAVRRIGTTEITSIALSMNDNVDDRALVLDLQTWLSNLDPTIQTNIQTARQIIDSIDAQMNIYAYLLLGIGSISLLVSGVGIMNVMLISVLERRQEIGLRRAIGAKKKDILILFLSNSLILCFIGAFIGIILGTIAGWVFAMLSGWSFRPSYMALPLGIMLALIVGLFFGIYPAIRAAKMDVVSALRSE
ncbi:ABC transporter permease [Bartonella apis]|uniref:ABC transporter permease n=1 Tax=Bartonella apis TaxID=1686310 RepID=UPI002430EF7A|nr:ABC transporter permease [Bartonella apis]